MKYLVGAILICTAILYIPFHLDSVQEKNEYGIPIGTKMKHIVEFKKNLEELAVNDLVVFNTQPPHFAKVGKQVNGVQRSLHILEDSIVKGKIGAYWAKEYLWEGDDLEWHNSGRTIRPDIHFMFVSGEVNSVFRNVPSRFSYFEQVGSIRIESFLFSFFIIWLLLRFTGSRVFIVAGLFVALYFIYDYIITDEVNSYELYPYGNIAFKIRAILDIIFLIFFGTSAYKWIGRLNDFNIEAPLKFIFIVLLFPVSSIISYSLVFAFHPEISMTFPYHEGVFGKIPIWGSFINGYVFAITGVLVLGVENYRKEKDERRKAVLSQQSTTAQLNSLQARLNPHFLYNSLNSITSLIKSEPDKAEEMTLSVSRFLKHFSNRESDHMTLLTEEVKMIKEYLAIEKIRFGESLTYEINITAKAYDQLVARSLLQPLVENAIKYGYSTDHNSVHISIDVTMQEHQMIMSISDSGSAWDENLQKGYGLSSVYNKLSLIYGDDYDVSFVNDPVKKIVIIIATDKVKAYD